jgi:acetyl esterase/lipase
MKVLLIDYHKAPEFPFPAALNDAVAAYRALIELKGYQAKYITIAGDSAGGGLALAVQHACKERKLPMPGASICLSPWVDLVEMGGSIETNADKDPLIDIRKMRFWASSYAGEYDITHSLISPLYGKFNDFGPILIQTSRDEMLYDNARKLARKAETAGVDITLQTWDGLIHWWHLFTGIVPEADEAVEKAAQFLLNTYELPTLK